MWGNLLKKNIVSRLSTRKISKNLERSELTATLRPGEIPASQVGIKYVTNQEVHNDINISNSDLAGSIHVLKFNLKNSASQTKSCRLLDDFFSRSYSYNDIYR